MFGRIILGLLIMAIGGGMIYYSANLVEALGRSKRADEHLGGSRQLRMLIGFGMVVVGGLVMLGVVSFADPTNIDTTNFS